MAKTKSKNGPDERSGRTTVPLVLPADLATEVADTAGSIGLSKADTMRLALKRGLPVLLKQLEGVAPDHAA